MISNCPRAVLIVDDVDHLEGRFIKLCLLEVVDNDGGLEAVWSCGPILSNSLVDLLDTGDRDEEVEEERENEDEFDFDDYIESDGER